MIDCHDMGDQLEWGASAVPFLIQLAKMTRRPEGKAIVPHPDIVTPETRKRDLEYILVQMKAREAQKRDAQLGSQPEERSQH